ncbi:hypothetical protein D3C87_1509130 [compost metagenome]
MDIGRVERLARDLAGVELARQIGQGRRGPVPIIERGLQRGRDAASRDIAGKVAGNDRKLAIRAIVAQGGEFHCRLSLGPVLPQRATAGQITRL